MSDVDVSAAPRSSLALSALSRAKRFAFSLRKWWWIVVVMSAAGVCVAAWLDSKKAPSYISVGRMMVSGRIALPEGAVYSEELQNFYGTQSELMQCVQVRQNAAVRVETGRPDLQAVPVSLTVAPQHGTSFFVLTAMGSRPEYTQAYLDACMEEYIRFKRDKRSETSDSALTSITDELLRLDKDLETSQEEVLAFQKTNNVVFLEEEGNSAGKHLSQLNQKLAGLRMEYELLKVLNLDQSLERRQQNGPSGTTPPVDGASDATTLPLGAEGWYLQGKQQIQVLKAEKEQHSRFMRPKHPVMVKLDAEIAQQERLIELFREQSLAQLANRRESLRLEIENLEISVKEWEEKALELTRKISEYNQLKAIVDRKKSLSDRLLMSVQTVDVTKSLQPDVITTMDKASVPTAIVPGLTRDLIVGGVAGLLVGLGIVFLLGMLDERIASIVELQERFPEQVLAHIPYEASAGRLSLLTLNDRQHVFAESYRNLRSTLYFMPFDEARPKAFLITSAVPGEGKSTVAANLAMTIAGGGSRTLLIDADLRKGVLHEYFSAASSPGLSGVLKEEIGWKDVLVETGVRNLTLMPRGKAGTGTSEDFLSRMADRLLQEVYSEYDSVIIDSAPVLANDDTPSLAPKIDAVLFVVRAGVSSARLTRSALDALYKRQVNVLGLILNGADGKSAEYYYYHKYGEYYGESKVEGAT
jgi:capsular exopolysaccharide synthesis family protein